jgi:hypothetical protein
LASWRFEDSKYIATAHAKGELIKGQHEAIIDRATWDRVQEVLNDRAHPWSRRYGFRAYRGFMKCGACGRLMTPYIAKGHVYHYSSNPRGERCRHRRGYTEAEVERAIREALGRFQFPKELFDWLRTALRSASADSAAATRQERKRLQTEINRCDEQIDKATDVALATSLTRP